jgi:hypothetical protein
MVNVCVRSVPSTSESYTLLTLHRKYKGCGSGCGHEAGRSNGTDKRRLLVAACAMRCLFMAISMVPGPVCICRYGVMFDSPLSMCTPPMCSVLSAHARVPWPHLSMCFNILVVPLHPLIMSHQRCRMPVVPHPCGSTPSSPLHEPSAFHIRQQEDARSLSSRPSSRAFRRGHRRG